MASLRIVFMGSADLACPGFLALLEDSLFQLVALVTQPDRPKGREMKVQPSAIKQLGLNANLPVLQPLKARDPQFIEDLKSFEPDLMVVIAFGQILPPEILEMPRFGCLNVHTSILPKYRGAAPIQWAVYNGDSETGVSIMKMDAGLDTGPVLAIDKTQIEPSDTSQTLHHRLGQMGAELLVKTIPLYCSGELQPQPQAAEGASYASKITKEHGKIDWNRTADQIRNQIRAFNPWPGSFTRWPVEGRVARTDDLAHQEGVTLKIWEASVLASDIAGKSGTVLSTSKQGIDVACGSQILRVHTLQKEGGKKLTAEQFLTGHSLPPGTVLGER